jgi:hypothetical protein
VPAKNIYHDGVVRALVADGWTVTHDPLTLSFGGKDLFVDLGAERTTIAAERGGQRIAVEIQSFLGASSVRDLQEAVGQYEGSDGPSSPRRNRSGCCIWPCQAASTTACSRSGSAS